MPATRSELLLLLSCLDLTSLGEEDDRARILALCRAADTRHGTPAAVCVHPEWVDCARTELNRLGLHAVQVATVVNFPDGSGPPQRVASETRRAIAAGADEIDMVLPWQALLHGEQTPARMFHHASAAAADVGALTTDPDEMCGLARDCVAAARSACDGAGDGRRRRLKVILESGELDSDTLLAAGRLALAAGADFLKTSTGKRPVGATLPAAEALLRLLHEAAPPAPQPCGFKAAGGIRSVADALPYLRLAGQWLGPAQCTPARFRIGASALLTDLLHQLDAGPVDDDKATPA